MKSFKISIKIVEEAFTRIKQNKGSEGVDRQTIKEFENNKDKNIYKIWNRMSSGSYFPQPVKIVEIPKTNGQKRKLGIPTVSDRVAQMVVKIHLEPELEKYFHNNSYGYRPEKSAHQAIGMTRKRCWENDWVIDMDIKGFFDNINHKLMMKMLKKHTKEKWILLYVERWLKAPAKYPDGKIEQRNIGTPQGGVISPLLANLYLHYIFDRWMSKEYCYVPFERYADDIVVHCRSEEQAQYIKNKIETRLNKCRLELHPKKTKIVYCKDSSRKGKYKNIKFDFLGYTFRPRLAKSKSDEYFISFSPGISNNAKKKIFKTIREWNIHSNVSKEIGELAYMYNPIIRGWINYYGAYYKSALFPVLLHINRRLSKWAMKKYKKLRGHKRRASKWITRMVKRNPKIFAHWSFLYKQTIGQ
jgi:RNA-directed DNA polymerase